MSLENPTRLLSYDDYAAIDDGQRYQVIEGELVLTTSPALRHQWVVPLIWQALHQHAVATKAGKALIAPFDVVLRAERPAVVVQPDVLFICSEHLEIVTPANVQGVPDLVVEVLSPSNARLDAIRKLGLYAKYGVQEVWFVPLDFDRVETLRLQPDGHYAKPQLFLPGEEVSSALLPGFALPVASLFEGL
jgi:Uma2 family endonuclease